jgi:hypothetical protein
MRQGLIPALEENTDQIISGFEDMIDQLASRNGF